MYIYIFVWLGKNKFLYYKILPCTKKIHANINMSSSLLDLYALGKTLRNSNCTNKVEQFEQAKQNILGSCLSANNISKLLFSQQELMQQQEAEIFSDMVLNWSKFDASLAVPDMALFIKHSSLQIHAQFDIAKATSIFESLWKQANQPQVVQKLFQCYCSDNKDVTLHYVLFTILATHVEHLLSSTFLTMAQGKKELPKIITETIETEELKMVFSEVQLLVVKSFMGPPIGLNLRNILWHGFLAPQEFHSCYLTFLFVLYASLCHVIVNSTVVQQVTWVSKPFLPVELADDKFNFGLGLSALPKALYNDVEQYELFEQQVTQACKSSYFVLPGREQLLVLAMRAMYKENDWHKACCILFPLVEHSLRRVFVACNPLVNPKMLQAEEKELFSTLDVLLAHEIKLSETNIIPNNIGVELGESFVQACLDLMMYFDGPRFRDKLAHCETPNDMIKPFIVERLLSSYIAMVLELNIVDTSGMCAWHFVHI